MKTRTIIIIAAAGLMAACGGDKMQKDAKEFAELTVKQMNINKQMQEMSDDLQERYGANDSMFVEFNLAYVKEMLKLDIDDDFRDYLIEVDSMLREDPMAFSDDPYLEDSTDFDFYEDSLDYSWDD